MAIDNPFWDPPEDGSEPDDSGDSGSSEGSDTSDSSSSTPDTGDSSSSSGGDASESTDYYRRIDEPSDDSDSSDDSGDTGTSLDDRDDAEVVDADGGGSSSRGDASESTDYYTRIDEPNDDNDGGDGSSSGSRGGGSGGSSSGGSSGSGDTGTSLDDRDNVEVVDRETAEDTTVRDPSTGKSRYDQDGDNTLDLGPENRQPQAQDSETVFEGETEDGNQVRVGTDQVYNPATGRYEQAVVTSQSDPDLTTSEEEEVRRAAADQANRIREEIPGRDQVLTTDYDGDGTTRDYDFPSEYAEAAENLERFSDSIEQAQDRSNEGRADIRPTESGGAVIGSYEEIDQAATDTAQNRRERDVLDARNDAQDATDFDFASDNPFESEQVFESVQERRQSIRSRVAFLRAQGLSDEEIQRRLDLDTSFYPGQSTASKVYEVAGDISPFRSPVELDPRQPTFLQRDVNPEEETLGGFLEDRETRLQGGVEAMSKLDIISDDVSQQYQELERRASENNNRIFLPGTTGFVTTVPTTAPAVLDTEGAREFRGDVVGGAATFGGQLAGLGTSTSGAVPMAAANTAERVNRGVNELFQPRIVNEQGEVVDNPETRRFQEQLSQDVLPENRDEEEIGPGLVQGAAAGPGVVTDQFADDPSGFVAQEAGEEAGEFVAGALIGGGAGAVLGATPTITPEFTPNVDINARARARSGARRAKEAVTDPNAMGSGPGAFLPASETGGGRSRGPATTEPEPGPSPSRPDRSDPRRDTEDPRDVRERDEVTDWRQSRRRDRGFSRDVRGEFSYDEIIQPDVPSTSTSATPDVDADTTPTIGSRSNPLSRTREVVEPDTVSEPEAVSDPLSKTRAETRSRTETEVETTPRVEVRAEPRIEPDLRADIRLEPRQETRPEPQPEPQPEPDFRPRFDGEGEGESQGTGSDTNDGSGSGEEEEYSPSLGGILSGRTITQEEADQLGEEGLTGLEIRPLIADESSSSSPQQASVDTRNNRIDPLAEDARA